MQRSYCPVRHSHTTSSPPVACLYLSPSVTGALPYALSLCPRRSCFLGQMGSLRSGWPSGAFRSVGLTGLAIGVSIFNDKVSSLRDSSTLGVFDSRLSVESKVSG